MPSFWSWSHSDYMSQLHRTPWKIIVDLQRGLNKRCAFKQGKGRGKGGETCGFTFRSWPLLYASLKKI